VKAINLFVVTFRHFAKNNILFQIPWLEKKKSPKKGKLSIAKNCHNCRQYEWVLQIFLLSYYLISPPNLAKYTCELSSLEQHYKIEEKKHWVKEEISFLRAIWRICLKVTPNFYLSVTRAHPNQRE
jgi:hypothetical protein